MGQRLIGEIRKCHYHLLPDAGIQPAARYTAAGHPTTKRITTYNKYKTNNYVVKSLLLTYYITKLKLYKHNLDKIITDNYTIQELILFIFT